MLLFWPPFLLPLHGTMHRKVFFWVVSTLHMYRSHCNHLRVIAPHFSKDFISEEWLIPSFICSFISSLKIPSSYWVPGNVDTELNLWAQALWGLGLFPDWSLYLNLSQPHLALSALSHLSPSFSLLFFLAVPPFLPVSPSPWVLNHSGMCFSHLLQKS